MAKPTLSIIVPLFNRANLIKETIESLLLQTYRDFECIMIDDHSSDNSFEVASSYVNGDERFIIRRRSKSTKGASACRNEAINLASGAYIMFLDSDDLMDPICIEQRLNFIQQSPKNDFFVFQVALFNHENYVAHALCANLDSDNDLDAFLNYTGGWNISSTVFNSNFLKGKHYFDEKALSWQDIEFHLRALAKNPKYLKYFSATPDVYVRISDEPRITNSPWTYLKLASRIQLYLDLENHPGFDSYKRIFLFLYLRDLEIGARTLDKKDYEQLRQLWTSQYQYKNMTSSRVLTYLNFQNFLSRNKMHYVGTVLFWSLRLCLRKELPSPHKEVKLEKKIDIKKRFSSYKQPCCSINPVQPQSTKFGS